MFTQEAVPAKKTPAKQLDREINEVLAKGPNGNGGMERVTRERVHEALRGEQVTRTDPVTITLLAAIATQAGRARWPLAGDVEPVLGRLAHGTAFATFVALASEMKRPTVISSTPSGDICAQ